MKILTGVDGHSRFCVLAHAMPRATACPVCEAFAQALRAFGVPQAVLMDNGRVFSRRAARSRHEVLFDRICRENGIRHLVRRTSPFAERLHEPDPVFVEPSVPAEIRYLEPMSSGLLRHAAFRQLGGRWSH